MKRSILITTLWKNNNDNNIEGHGDEGDDCIVIDNTNQIQDKHSSKGLLMPFLR